MKKVYLDPVDGRKSFYCKASMEMMGGVSNGD